MPMTEEERVQHIPAGRRAGAARRTIEQPALPDLQSIFWRTWYLVQVAAGRETLVADLMRNRGHDAIVPVVRCWRRPNRHARGKRQREFALLARYVIVGFAPDAIGPFDDLRRFDFVQSVVSDANGYAPIMRRQLIAFVRQLGGPVWTVDGAQRFMRTHHEFAVGDTVEVVEGSLAGWRARVSAIDGASALLEVMLFNRLTTLHLPLEILSKAV